MQARAGESIQTRRTDFVESLGAFSRQHRAQHWQGSFGDFLTSILPANPAAFARTSHQYIWDMLRWYGRSEPGSDETARASALFRRELYGVEEPLARVVEYFKAAAAGSDVGRRLLLLLGPPSGGKSTLAILLKRALEEYSRTEEGALYGIRGSPMHESPLNLIPASLRAPFRETYGVDVPGSSGPVCLYADLKRNAVVDACTLLQSGDPPPNPTPRARAQGTPSESPISLTDGLGGTFSPALTMDHPLTSFDAVRASLVMGWADLKLSKDAAAALGHPEAEGLLIGGFSIWSTAHPTVPIPPPLGGGNGLDNTNADVALLKVTGLTDAPVAKLGTIKSTKVGDPVTGDTELTANYAGYKSFGTVQFPSQWRTPRSSGHARTSSSVTRSTFCPERSRPV